MYGDMGTARGEEPEPRRPAPSRDFAEVAHGS
jgi:hypothetical protein